MKKKIKICLLLIILIVPLLLSGCTHEMVSLYLYTMPSKLVYAKGEELSLKGMVLKNIKTDSALMKVWNNSANFDGFDSTKTGKQTIRVSYGKFTTSFTVYVENKVVSENDNLNEIIASFLVNFIKPPLKAYSTGRETSQSSASPDGFNQTCCHSKC